MEMWVSSLRVHLLGSGSWGSFLEEVVPCHNSGQLGKGYAGEVPRLGRAWWPQWGLGSVEMECFSDLIVSELLEDLLKQVGLSRFLSCLPDFHTEHLWGCPPKEVVQGAPVLCHPHSPGGEQ